MSLWPFVDMFSLPSSTEQEDWRAFDAIKNQYEASRRPPMEFGTLRSSYDFDGIASDAVEGRSKQLSFYRGRGLNRF